MIIITALGCGATGDVIDFVARIFQIGNKEAAERIAADFGLQYDSQVPCVPPKRTATAVQIAKQRERYTYGVLTAITASYKNGW